MTFSTGLLIEAQAPAHHTASIGLVCGANRGVGDHLGSIGSLPIEAMGLANAMGPFKDQNGSSTCVGHGLGRGADTRMRVQGIIQEYPSVRAIYTLSNELLRAKKTTKLEDTGTYARVAMQGCADFGVPFEKDWPLWKEDGSGVYDVTQEVPPDVLQRASAWKLKEQFTVYETGQARIDRCCDALAKNFPLPCASTVDDVFGNHTGLDVLPAPIATATDGHMLCIVGYRTNITHGKREFLISNSWLDWGFNLTSSIRGVAWVSEEWVLALHEIYSFTMTHGVAA